MKQVLNIFILLNLMYMDFAIQATTILWKTFVRNVVSKNVIHVFIQGDKNVGNAYPDTMWIKTGRALCVVKAASLAHLQPSANIVTPTTTGIFQIRLVFAGVAISSTKVNAFDVLPEFRIAYSVRSRVFVLPVTIILSLWIIVAWNVKMFYLIASDVVITTLAKAAKEDLSSMWVVKCVKVVLLTVIFAIVFPKNVCVVMMIILHLEKMGNVGSALNYLIIAKLVIVTVLVKTNTMLTAHLAKVATISSTVFAKK